MSMQLKLEVVSTTCSLEEIQQHIAEKLNYDLHSYGPCSDPEEDIQPYQIKATDILNEWYNGRLEQFGLTVTASELI